MRSIKIPIWEFLVAVLFQVLWSMSLILAPVLVFNSAAEPNLVFNTIILHNLVLNSPNAVLKSPYLVLNSSINNCNIVSYSVSKHIIKQINNKNVSLISEEKKKVDCDRRTLQGVNPDRVQADIPPRLKWYNNMYKIDIEKIKRVPIRRILATVGIQPSRSTAKDAFYHAPWRAEKTPSLHVDFQTNLWFDFGAGYGGSSIDMIIRLGLAHDCRSAIEWLATNMLDSTNAADQSVEDFRSRTVNTQTCSYGAQVVQVVPIQSFALIRYFGGRGIPFEVLGRYCSEVHYRLEDGREYYGAGMVNLSGGYAVRNPRVKINVGPADISLFGGNGRTCAVYEGMTDMLSAEVLYGPGNEDRMVLHSVSSVRRAIPFLEGYTAVRCLLDNDTAGRRATEEIIQYYPATAVDCAETFYGFKDINDKLLNINKI